MGIWNEVFRALKPIARDVAKAALREQSGSRRSKRQQRDSDGRPQNSSGRSTSPRPKSSTGYPGDYYGCPEMVYAPREDRQVQPGEMVWTWVPFEEDHSQGKDRPVLIIADDGEFLLALPATSQDHDADAAQERRHGRYWMDIGAGDWDAQHRATEVRLDRIIRVREDQVRKIAGRISEKIFKQVANGVRQHWKD